MYKATYKCRMCGETYSAGEYDLYLEKIGTGTFETVLDGLINQRKELKDLKDITPHNCPDGSIGYADFVGFKKGE